VKPTPPVHSIAAPDTSCAMTEAKYLPHQPKPLVNQFIHLAMAASCVKGRPSSYFISSSSSSDSP
jgi:hypothetical protein